MARARPLTALGLALGCAAACSGNSAAAPGPGVTTDRDGAGGTSSVGNDGAAVPDVDAGSAYRGCGESAERVRVKSDALSGTSFSLLARGLDVHVAYMTPTCIGVDGNGTAHGLRYVHLMSTGPVTEPIDLAYADGASCAPLQHPALTDVDGVLSLAYAGAPQAPWTVFGRRIEAKDAAALSSARATRGIPALAAADVADQSWTAWAEDDAARTSAIWLAGVDGKAAERLLVSRDAGYHVTALALRAFPETADSAVRAALAFASDSADKPGVFLIALDAELKPVAEEVVQLSSAAPGAVSVDLQAGGILYTSGSAQAPDLRFRALDAEAAPVGDEVRITNASERAAAGSLTPFTVGYAIAYRSLQPDAQQRAWLRLTLIDPQGNLAGYRNLFETSADGGKVLIRTAVDGRLALGFRELAADGTAELHVARVTCGL